MVGNARKVCDAPRKPQGVVGLTNVRADMLGTVGGTLVVQVRKCIVSTFSPAPA